MSTEKVSKRLDWHLFWTACGVIVTLGGILISGFISMNSSMNSQFNKVNEHISAVENRLTKIEVVLVLKGLMPKEWAREDSLADDLSTFSAKPSSH